MKFIKKILLGIIASAVAIYATTHYFPDYLTVEGGIRGFLIAGAIFGVLNGIVKPLLKLISLPLIFITAGLFSFLINGAIIYIAEYLFREMPSLGVTFTVNGGFTAYISVAVILSIINWATHWIIDVGN